VTISPEILADFKDAAGPGGFTDDPHEIAPHLVEWRGKYRGHTPILLKPDSTASVAAILAVCTRSRTPIVPQGGNTGLVGGQIPHHGEILLSLERLNRIRRVDPSDMSLTAEAGVTLAGVQAAALDAGCFFPLSLASEGSCTIGGNLSTNAGGTAVLRYGSARALVLGLEVVLADGRILDLLGTLRKDNTGYDLKQMFIGAEGTLGVITTASLRLFPRPWAAETAFIAVPDPSSALGLLGRLRAASGDMLSAFELLPRRGLDFVLSHIPGTSDPLSAPSPWYVLAEAQTSGDFPLRTHLEKAIAEAIDAGSAADAVFAESGTQREALWRLRESLSEAQKYEGASIKHDVSVPTARVPEFLNRGLTLLARLAPGARPVPFGHLGDGNIHFNVTVAKGGDDAAFLARWEEITKAVHDLVHDMGGSISAEHGIGTLKREQILRYKSPVEMDLMRALKRTLDPDNILNPGKVV
jgi:FAD/FMN-containing dehydrogenase